MCVCVCVCVCVSVLKSEPVRFYCGPRCINLDAATFVSKHVLIPGRLLLCTMMTEKML